MAEVSAPYNFVPLNEKVFFPPWAPFVSHDIPFEDGLSGKIELEITAESPIFIRKQYEEGDLFYPENEEDENKRISKEFCHVKYKEENGKDKKRYYIPGSSIRNMLRSVVEIMSFSKLNFFNKPNKYSFRDMANRHLYNLRDNIAENLHYGWLYKKDSSVFIKDLGLLGSLRNGNNAKTIPHTNPKFNGINNIDSNLDDNGEIKINFFETKYLSEKYKLYRDKGNRDAIIDSTNSTHPVIVLTGNIGGKEHEFKFENPNNEDIAKIKLSKDKFEEFINANMINDSENDNWNFWKQRFENNHYVPVFFRKENNNHIKDFGLTVLYKMLYKNSLYEIIRKQQIENDSSKMDLSETIFGTIDNVKLKGRVQISHAFSNNDTLYREQTFILNEPKSSYYPFYLKQPVNNDTQLKERNGTSFFYNTLSDTNAKISGRKRYPIHYVFNPDDIIPRMERDDNEANKNIDTFFIPLDSNTSFKTFLNYNNLLPVELGALLSAITFHNSSNCYHNIGLAKAYGFGKISISINNTPLEKLTEYIGAFEKQMEVFYKKEYNNKTTWLQSDEIRELIAMSFNYEEQNRGKMKYMALSDFNNIKNESKALPLYSKFMNLEQQIIQLILNTSKEYKGLIDYQFDEKFETLKSSYLSKMRDLITNINGNINRLNSSGIESLLGNCIAYSDLLSKINQYKRSLNIPENDPLDTGNIPFVIKQLNTVYNNLRGGRKKKQFINNNSKFNTIKSWISEEKATEWFNSKKQQ